MFWSNISHEQLPCSFSYQTQFNDTLHYIEYAFIFFTVKFANAAAVKQCLGLPFLSNLGI